MRATLNIVFSLLLLVVQSMALVAPHSVEKPETCKCCSCGSGACTTTRTPAPPASPLAAQVQEARAEVRKAGLRPEPTPSLPAACVTIANATVRPVSLSLIASSRPLYERFCFLLI